jgi:hypothetical protein
MLNEVDRPLYGVRTDVVMHQNLARMQEIDERVASRFVPDSPLPPNFGPRPAMTKYAVFPMLDNRMPTTEPIRSNYAPSGMFSPPTQGPVAQYARNVDVEADLRNQMRALQKNVDDNAYVPASTSDMYQVVPVGGVGTGRNTDHGLLFQQFAFEAQPGLPKQIGGDLLHNGTRAQLRSF